MSKNRSSYQWISIAAGGVLAAALAGCGGGGGSTDSGFAVAPVPGAPAAGVTAVPGAPPAPPAPAGTAPITLTATTPAATMAALAPVVTVGGASISSPPMVTFSVADAAGNPIIGLGATKQSATQVAPVLAYFNFALAKLVPGTNGSPSKWVNYAVVGVPRYTSATDKTIVPGTLGRPSTDNTGTLTDYKNGIYVYKFYRDITKVKDEVAAMPAVTAPNDKADLGDLTYDPNLVHRLVIQISGNAWGTGTQTPTGVDSGVPAVRMANPVNLVYDFIPATGKAVTVTDASRDIVSTAKCNECHGSIINLGIHGGGRYETKFCVVCHTEQRKYGRAEATTTATGYSGSTTRINDFAVGNYPNYIHRLHKGEMLSKTGYNYANVLFNEIKFPQDIRNCVKCHDGTTGAANATKNGDNWNKVPNRLACGTCHDTVKFSDGTNHEGGAMADDSLCALCHTPANIRAYHVPTVAPDPRNTFLFPTATSSASAKALAVAAGQTSVSSNTNASYLAAYPNNLPVGTSKITYVINKVTVVDGVPSMEFKFQKDGTDVVFNDPTVKTEMMDNFVGSPSIYFAFGVPQDGITAPLDWNATVGGYLKRIWDGSAAAVGQPTQAGTLTGPVGGWYTVTLTGVTIPTTATMITGAIGYTYSLGNPYPPTSYAGTTTWTAGTGQYLQTTQPLTQTNVASTTKSLTNVARAYAYNAATRQGGVSVPPSNVFKVATVTVAGVTKTNTARRDIVSSDKCNACHNALGVFTEATFHSGQRNKAETCTFCHNVNRVGNGASGWSVNIKEAVHSLHAARKREQKFSWYAYGGFKFWEVTYPNKLNNCEACHLAGTYDFSAPASAAAATSNRLLWSTAAAGTVSPTAIVIRTGAETVPTTSGEIISPWITAGTAYGSGFSYNATTQAITNAAGTTLVNSPIASACFACHDTAVAKSHMESQGGRLYAARSTVTPSASTETCLFCHDNSAGLGVGIKARHSNFK